MFGIYPKSFKEIQLIIDDCSSIDDVIIYGSRAKGNYKEGSDIDLYKVNSAFNNSMKRHMLRLQYPFKTHQTMC